MFGLFRKQEPEHNHRIGDVVFRKGSGEKPQPFLVDYVDDIYIGGFWGTTNQKGGYEFINQSYARDHTGNEFLYYRSYHGVSFYNSRDIIPDGEECDHGCRNKDYCLECKK